MSTVRIVEAFDLSGIGPSLKLAAIYLGDNGSPETHEMPVNIKRLATFCCCAESTAEHLLGELVYIGFLEGAQESIASGVWTVWFAWHDGYRRSSNAKPAVSKEARAYVTDRDVDCVYCGCTEGPYHIDHIVPRSRGGDNDVSNLALACATCNISKRAKLISEWTGPKDKEVSFERALNILGGRA